MGGVAVPLADERTGGVEADSTAGRLRVLFLSDHLGYAHGMSHGATTYFLNVLPALGSQVDLTVCFLRERHPASERLAKHGIRPIFLGRCRSDPRPVLDLAWLIRRERIEVVHAAGMKGILVGRLAARLGGARAVIHLHDLARPGPLLGVAQRLLGPGTAAALAVSRAVAHSVEHEFAVPRSRVRVMYNPLHLGRYAQVSPGARERIRAELRVGPAQPVIGVLGRFSPAKGHEQLLRALPAVLERVPDAVVVAVGDGPLRRACEDLGSRAGLAGAVRFAGYRSDVPDVLAAVDLVALPSVSEGCPYAALEAMASGRPVVAFAVGGVPEIVRHEANGLLVPAADVAGLAAAIVRVIREPGLAGRLAAAGRRDVEQHSVEAHVRQLVAVYGETAARAQPANADDESRVTLA